MVACCVSAQVLYAGTLYYLLACSLGRLSHPSQHITSPSNRLLEHCLICVFCLNSLSVHYRLVNGSRGVVTGFQHVTPEVCMT